MVTIWRQAPFPRSQTLPISTKKKVSIFHYCRSIWFFCVSVLEQSFIILKFIVFFPLLQFGFQQEQQQPKNILDATPKLNCYLGIITIIISDESGPPSWLLLLFPRG